jgi:hypothetical protein
MGIFDAMLLPGYISSRGKPGWEMRKRRRVIAVAGFFFVLLA